MELKLLCNCLLASIISFSFVPSMALASKAVILPLTNQMYVLPIPPSIPTVVSKTGRRWMDRNLGATRVATSMTDSKSLGDLYQWGRLTDGHEKRNSPLTGATSSTDVPGHNYFINPPGTDNNWRVPRNDKLWQGENGINNPCPEGFRLPTIYEFIEEMDSWTSDNAAGAFTSALKLPIAGWRSPDNNTIFLTVGVFWTSSTAPSVNADYSMGIVFNSNVSLSGAEDRATGLSVRCIED